jgi:hypothetical protein
MAHRKRLVAGLAALLGVLSLATIDATGVAGSAGVGGAPPQSPGRGPEVKPDGRQQRPVNPPNAPPIPVGRRPVVPPGQEKRAIVQNCYAPGTDGYQSDCQNPGFEGGSAHAHWGNEPYYNTNHRYVWVVDELGPSREREWLQYTVNQFNAVATGNRPYFLYYTGEQLGWGGCAQNQAQFVVVCYQGGQRSATNYGWNGFGHFTQTYMYIGNQARFVNDYYIEYSLAHEFGHAIGFAHDTSCSSVMTYCGTVGTQYLWYGPDQTSVYASVYDAHANN